MALAQPRNTCVSIDDPDGAEWNTAALGPDKRRLSAELFQRMRKQYAPQGLVHFGQGKWYPGEQLPRWSLNCYWRRDGQAIWHNDALIADEQQDYGADGRVRLEYRDFAFIGEESFDAAVCARCAEGQGRRWQYADYLFVNQSGE